MPPTPKRQGEDAARLRDAALRRLSLTRRWIIAGAAALTAGLAALVSAILPGKSLGAKSPASAVPTAASGGSQSASSPDPRDTSRARRAPSSTI
jgi:hypothetical protein